MGSVMVSPLLASHSAAHKVGAAALGSWVESICWLSRNGRQGSFPISALGALQATPRTTWRLIDQYLWIDEGDRIRVPQRVRDKWNANEVHLWKFGPLVGGRRKIPEALRRSVYQRDGYLCLHCGAANHLTLDHIHPFSLGGQDTYDNLQTLCRSCNSRKGARV